MNLSEPLQQIDRTYVRIGKRRLSYFAGCDYFRLASHPKVLRAMEVGLRTFGLNVAASRLTTGNHVLYGKLETELAKFFSRESAVVVPNGYATNLIVAQALAGQFTHVLIDEKAHPSLCDAAKVFGCRIIQFKHRDAADLSRVFGRSGKNPKPILLTDGMFSHDGSIAPLAEYQKRLPTGSRMLVDEAHSAGTLGATGRGALELEGVDPRRIVQTITLSKAFGVYGGAILCSRKLAGEIFAKSKMFVGSTPLPLPLANAALTSIAVLRTDKSLRRRLARNVDYTKAKLRAAGLPVVDSPSPLIAHVPGNAKGAAAMTKRCLSHGIFPSLIKYPGGPENGYFRFAISSEHSKAQLDALLKVLV